MMIIDFLNYLRYERNRSELTVRNYEKGLKDFESYFKNRDCHLSCYRRSFRFHDVLCLPFLPLKREQNWLDHLRRLCLAWPLLLIQPRFHGKHGA